MTGIVSIPSIRLQYGTSELEMGTGWHFRKTENRIGGFVFKNQKPDKPDRFLRPVLAGKPKTGITGFNVVKHP